MLSTGSAQQREQWQFCAAKTAEAGGLCKKCSVDGSSVDGAWEEVQLPSHSASHTHFPR